MDDMITKNLTAEIQIQKTHHENIHREQPIHQNPIHQNSAVQQIPEQLKQDILTVREEFIELPDMALIQTEPVFVHQKVSRHQQPAIAKSKNKAGRMQSALGYKISDKIHLSRA